MKKSVPLLGALVLVLAVLAIYWPVRGFGFVQYDDPVYVQDNPHVAEGLDAREIAWVFTHDHAANYHPLTWLSHMLDVELFGLESPGPQHLVNVALHAANALLVLLLARRLGLGLAPALLAAAVFALHPLRVESVAWISERKDVLCAFFSLASLLAYLRHRRAPSAGRFLVVFALTALALLAKPMAVTLPVVMLLMDAWPLGRLREGSREPAAETPSLAPTPDSPARAPTPDSPFPAPTPDSPFPAPTPDWPFPAPTRPGKTSQMRVGFRLCLEKGPLFVLVVLAALATVLAQSRGGSTSSLDQLAPDLRALNAFASVKSYLVRTLWPSGLAVFYPHAALVSETPRRALMAPALLGLGLCLMGSWWLLRRPGRHPVARLGWAWFGVTLLPVLGLVQVGAQASADRYTYFPAVGLSLVLGGLLARVRPRSVLVGGALLALPLALAARHQTNLWSDTRLLFEHARRVTERNYVAEGKLGELARAEGDADGARAAFRRALEIHPSDLDALNNLALLLLDAGDFPQATAFLERARRLAPDEPDTLLNLGVVALESGDGEAAEAWLRASLAQRPDQPDAHYDLGLVALRRGDAAAAERHLRTALGLDPELAEAWDNLGQVLLLLEREAEAVAAYERAAALAPDDPVTLFNLSVAHERVGRLSEARADLERALAIDPDFELARKRLAALDSGAGR